MDPMALLLGDGTLEQDYQKLVSTCNILPMLDAGIEVDAAIKSAILATPRRPEAVVCSTVATAAAPARACRSLDLPVIHLINELPTTVESNGWEDLVLDIGALGQTDDLRLRLQSKGFHRGIRSRSGSLRGCPPRLAGRWAIIVQGSDTREDSP